MESHASLYGEKEYFDVIHEALILCVSSSTSTEKWICFREMDHLIVSAYNRVCIDLTIYSFLETFLQLQSNPPQNSYVRIMCND